MSKELPSGFQHWVERGAVYHTALRQLVCITMECARAHLVFISGKLALLQEMGWRIGAKPFGRVRWVEASVTPDLLFNRSQLSTVSTIKDSAIHGRPFHVMPFGRSVCTTDDSESSRSRHASLNRLGCS